MPGRCRYRSSRLSAVSRARELGLWNRVVANDAASSPTTRRRRQRRARGRGRRPLTVLRSKNQQALRQLKLIINKGVEADLHTAQGFETLSAGLTAAVNGRWQIADADQGQGVLDFSRKGELWQDRRRLAADFWTEER